MNANEILKLIDAGFTADEIRGMITPEPAVEPAPAAEPAPAPAPAQKDPAPAEPAPAAPGPDPLDDIKQQIAGLASTVKEMSKSIITPNLADIKPQGIEDVISNFFKED